MNKCHAVDPRELQHALRSVFDGAVAGGQIQDLLIDLVTSQSEGKSATVDISEVRALMQSCSRAS